MDRATKEHMKGLYRVMNYVINTKNFKLFYNINQKDVEQTLWKMEAFCDSDYAGDSESRKSILGYVIYFCGCAVAWKSHGQKSVNLLSTEAEYKAILEVVTDVLFVKMLLEFFGFEVKLPIQIKVDNVGAIYLAQSAGSTGCTKHIDIHHHYV